MKIPEAEIRFSRLSLVDIGRVFWWRGRLFRAVLTHATPLVERMFDCGLVERLVEAGLLVGSQRTTYELEGYGLVIEHEIVPVPTYPREWSFSMLKDAGLLLLAVNDLAKDFGFQTKDCNGYNVLFRRGRPVYVDLGSFVEVPRGEDVLLSYAEFLRSYVYPLWIWRSAGQYLGGRVAPRAVGVLLAQEAYLRFRWPVARLLNDARLRAWWRKMTYVQALRHEDLGKREGRLRGSLLAWLSFEKKAGLLRGPARIGRLRRRLQRLVHETGASLWANYHDGFSGGGTLRTTKRFDTVVRKLVGLKVGSVLEIAGNQGVVSRLLLQALPDARIICTDPDGLAIDKGYLSAKAADAGVEWAILDPFASEASPVEVATEDRLRCDAVVVLALTHHLTLTFGYRLDYIFDVIGRYARRHVFIEFMPLGLHDGTRAPPLPDWYDEAWFRAAFCRRFRLIERLDLESNRILYIGANDIATPLPGADDAAPSVAT
jgi:hypothetical protein